MIMRLRDDCLARAHELGMGIVAMKVIGGGWLGRWSGYLVPDFDKQQQSPTTRAPPFATCCKTIPLIYWTSAWL